MNLTELSPTLSIRPQVMPAEVAELAALGFSTIICNRPDGEGAGQPLFAEVAKAATAAGMSAHHLPVVPGQITPDHISEFARLTSEADGKVIAFCASGKRSTMLWEASQ